MDVKHHVYFLLLVLLFTARFEYPPQHCLVVASFMQQKNGRNHTGSSLFTNQEQKTFGS